MISQTWIEALTRIAMGDNLNISGMQLPAIVKHTLIKTDQLKLDLKQDNVLSAMKAMFPDHFYNQKTLPLSNDELLYILRQESHKHRIMSIEQKISRAILSNRNNNQYDWSALVNELGADLSEGASSGREYLTFGDIDWFSDDKESVVSSFGYPLLDALVEGGIVEGSYSVFYSEANCGKSTVVTRHLTSTLLQSGKTPLIISLEGQTKITLKKILLQMAGMAQHDPSTPTLEQRKKLQELAIKYKDIPIVDKGATQFYELMNLNRIYKPDVLIYDQITIGADSRDWKDIAKMSETLKKFSLETGVPVVAITQSNGKNYSNGTDVKEVEENQFKNEIKYASAIFEDALTVVHVGFAFPASDHKRIFTIRKTKDDITASKLPVQVSIEWTDKGMVDTAVKMGQLSKWIPKSEFLATSHRNSVINKLQINSIKEDTNEQTNSLDISDTDTTVVYSDSVINTEIGRFAIPENAEGSYGKDRYESTGDRLYIIGKLLGIDSLVSMADTWKEKHKAEYGKMFITENKIDPKADYPYLPYYHGKQEEEEDD